MAAFHTFLAWSARQGRFILIAGLLVGLASPALARLLQNYLPEMVAVLLFIAALRIKPRDALGNRADMRWALGIVLLYQVVLPLVLIALFQMFNVWGPVPLAIVLMASAASIAGSANLALMTGNNPAPALRLLIVGTALLPVTIVPVFVFLPELGPTSAILLYAGRLLLLIALAAGSAWVLRYWLMPQPSERALASIDGLSAWAMAILVIGLMAAIGPALRENPGSVALVLLVACIANFGLQALGWFGFRDERFKGARGAYAIVAGNRNMALFLSSLPAATMEPLMLFIGCYQIPMYFTPLFLRFLTGRKAT